MDPKLVPALSALDASAPTRDESVLKLVLGRALGAADLHLQSAGEDKETAADEAPQLDGRARRSSLNGHLTSRR